MQSLLLRGYNAICSMCLTELYRLCCCLLPPVVVYVNFRPRVLSLAHYPVVFPTQAAALPVVWIRMSSEPTISSILQRLWRYRPLWQIHSLDWQNLRRHSLVWQSHHSQCLDWQISVDTVLTGKVSVDTGCTCKTSVDRVWIERPL